MVGLILHFSSFCGESWGRTGKDGFCLSYELNKSLTLKKRTHFLRDIFMLIHSVSHAIGQNQLFIFNNLIEIG